MFDYCIKPETVSNLETETSIDFTVQKVKIVNKITDSLFPGPVMTLKSQIVNKLNL